MSAVSDLAKFRKILVDVRRGIVAKAIEPGNIDHAQHATGVANAQSWIEAVDKAIKDEQELAGAA